MKSLVLVAALVALAAAGITQHQAVDIRTKSVDADFVKRQMKVLSLLKYGINVKNTEYYTVGKEYNIKANIDNYTNKEIVEKFWYEYKYGFLPKDKIFSIYSKKMMKEAIYLFDLFYYAKDFETFYKTAAFARVHFNYEQFVYAFYTVVFYRPDTRDLIMPSLYEIVPRHFVDATTMEKAFKTKMMKGEIDIGKYGITFENNNFVYYSNYSDSLFNSKESLISYFTEDIGMNEYHFDFNRFIPYWFKGDMYERRGEIVYFWYQQLMARYYMERLTNGLGEIPEFSWYKPIKTGYLCRIFFYGPCVSRSNNYYMNTKQNYYDIEFLNNYEKTFLSFLEKGRFKAFNQEIDLHNPKSINFVSSYWLTNFDLYDKLKNKNYPKYYEHTGLRLLSATPEPFDQYTVYPSTLTMKHTALRDPVFYQYYKHVLEYIFEYKKYLKPYSYDHLHFGGVKIENVKVDKLVTLFEYFDFDISNDLFYSAEEIASKKTVGYKVRQPRLNHKPFSITVDIKSEVDTNAVIKFFLGPKYDSKGFPINFEHKWMDFVVLDWFNHKLTPGKNTIVRNSRDFFFSKPDSVTVSDMYELFKQGKAPKDLAHKFFFPPNRMMLPKGTKGGFPFQLYVVVYPSTGGSDYNEKGSYFKDTKPIAYPFDRPIDARMFRQPNIYYEKVYIYHEGAMFPYKYNIPGWTPKKY